MPGIGIAANNVDGVGRVDTGAKNVPTLISACEKLEQRAHGNMWVDMKKIPGEVVGQFRIFMGVDASDTVLLVKGKGGNLSLWEQNFGIHPGTGEPGLFHSLCRPIASLGRAVTAPGDFDDRATAYSYFGSPKNADGDLKRTGYNLALSGGQIFVEEPNVHGPHTILATMPYKGPAAPATVPDHAAPTPEMAKPGDVEASIAALVKKTVHVGEYRTLKGKIVHEPITGGSNRPAGAYLELGYPLNWKGTGPDGKTTTQKGVRRVYLGGIEHFPNGRAVVSGQISFMPLRPFTAHGPGEITGYLPMLSGTTDVGRGEPAFRGMDKGFFDKAGNKLPAIEWSDHVPDVPSHLVVINEDQGKAYLGGIGGFVANGPFRGFQHTVGMRQADELDRMNIVMQADGSVIDKANGDKALALVGQIADGGHTEPQPSKIFLDKDTNALYLFRQFGMTGTWALRSVIDMADRAPIIALRGDDTPAA
jgi:hypothetical protein